MLFIKSLLLACLYILYVLSKEDDTKYCDIMCGSYSHTLCTYAKGGTNSCHGFAAKLTEEDRVVLLDAHNSLRQQVALGRDPDQPSAANMMMMTWDPEAEMIAQRWADQCNLGLDKGSTDKCRTKLDGTEGGQNVNYYVSETPRDNLTLFFESKVLEWFETKRGYQSDWIDVYRYFRDTGNYAQLVWAKSDLLGCGFTYNESTNRIYRLVCNYYPKGLTDGEPVFIKGLACSACPDNTGCSKQWPGLCTFNVTDMGGQLPSDTINTEASAPPCQSPSHSFVVFMIILNLVLKDFT